MTQDFSEDDLKEIKAKNGPEISLESVMAFIAASDAELVKFWEANEEVNYRIRLRAVCQMYLENINTISERLGLSLVEVMFDEISLLKQTRILKQKLANGEVVIDEETGTITKVSSGNTSV